jgi:adenylylsulfate kinase-like enzyme
LYWSFNLNSRDQLTNFTGIDDPYEPPQKPELEIDTDQTSAPAAAALIVEYLERRGSA